MVSKNVLEDLPRLLTPRERSDKLDALAANVSKQIACINNLEVENPIPSLASMQAIADAIVVDDSNLFRLMEAFNELERRIGLEDFNKQVTPESLSRGYSI